MKKLLKCRWLLVCFAILCLGLFSWVASRRPIYSAKSVVTLQPYTNAVTSRAFEKQVVHLIPSVRRVTVRPGFSSTAAAAAWSTNKTPSGAAAPSKAIVSVLVLGSSPEDAQRAANDAATRLCTLLPERYGGHTTILEQADKADRWLLISQLKLQFRGLVP